MKRTILFLVLLTLLSYSSVFGQEISSFISEYGTGSTLLDAGVDVEYDSEGNILLYGFFDDDMDFDLLEGDQIVDPLGSPDLFIAKYNSAKELIWVLNLGRISLVDGMANGQMEIDNDNNIIISGGFASNVNFNPFGEANVLSSAGGEDVFVAKYNSDGMLIWVRQIGGISTDRAFCHSISADNNVAIGLGFSGDVDMDPGEGENIFINQGSVDAAVVALDENGDFLFAQQIGTPDLDLISSVKIASDGRVAVGALVNGATTGFPDRDMRLSFHEANGDEIWSYNFENFDDANIISHLMFSADGNSVYAGGRINGTTDFNPDSEEEEIIDPNFADPFIAKYNLDGSLEWARHVSSSGTEDYFSGMAEAGAALMVIGSFDVLATFEEGDFASQRLSSGGQDVYIASYDRLTGAWIEADVYGGSGDESVRESHFLEAGNLVCTGSFSTEMNLEEGGEPISGIGLTDVLLAEFAYQTDLSINSSADALEDVSIYPNPTSGEINLILPSDLLGQDLDIKLINVVGQQVFNQKIKVGSTRFSTDFSELNKGIYIIELSTGEQRISRRLVKQ